MTEFTDTDKKLVMTDHDLLVRAVTMLDIVRERQEDFFKTYDEKHTDLVRRVTTLEISQATTSKAIEDNCNEISELRKKSNLVDIANGVATAIVAALAFLFGK